MKQALLGLITFLALGVASPHVAEARPAEPPDAFQLLLFTLRLLPVSPATSPSSREEQDWLPRRNARAPRDADGDVDLLYRLELVQACVDATTDRSERYICAKIPRYESNYRIDVGRCLVKGAAGDLTAWQIVPRSREEKSRLCVSLAEDAKLAVERIRESRRACWRLPKQEQLALYARGRCDSEEGRKLSRHRFPTDVEVRQVEVF